MNDTQERKPRRRLAAAGLVAVGLVAGGILAGSQIASAQGSSSSTAAASTNAPSRNVDPATMKHGPGETLLTDGTATKVRDAALAAVPGATVIRVETDSAGAAYEAHLQKSDGAYVTVKLDKQFNVTGTENGFGSGPGGSNGAPPGSPPSGSGY